MRGLKPLDLSRPTFGISLAGIVVGEPVFDGKTEVKRRVPDPVTDDTLPAPGSLTWEGITEDTGLAETKGSDTRLITGDDFKKVK